MKTHVVTGPAKRDLTEIWSYLADQASPETADRVLRDLRQAMRDPASMPEMGHRREDLTRRPVRFWLVYSYLIVYRPETVPLQILRVLHGARDVEREMDG